MCKNTQSTPLQWDDLRYFITLAREGTLSAAARVLSVEHTTVARRVAQLEQSLRLKLFHRMPKGWVLTPEGEALGQQASLLETQILTLQRTALATPALAGKVSLSVPPHLLNVFLLPHLTEFKQCHPDIVLSLIGENRNAIMVHGEADIALRMVAPTEPGLIARPLAQVSYGLYATAAYLAQSSSTHAFIGFADEVGQRSQQQWLDEFMGSQPYSLHCNDFATMRAAARQSWGIALLPDFLVSYDDQLIRLSTPVVPSRPVYLVMHPDIQRTPRVRALADCLIEVFAHHPLAPSSATVKAP